jgi:hypothetical protein
VGSGTYEESISSINGNLVPNGSPNAYTRIIGVGKVFLAPVSLEPTLNGGIYLGGDSSYVEFNGIGGDGKYQSSSKWPGCCGIGLDGAYPGSIHHIRLLNGEFKNNKCGSMGFGNASDIEISGNHIHGDECFTFSHGLYVAHSNERFLIANNTVEGFNDYGLQFYSSFVPTASNSVVRDNIFRSNGSLRYGGGAMSIGGANNQIYNNTLEENIAGIRIQYTAPFNVQVFGNTIRWNAFNSVYVDDTAVNSVIRDNVIYGNGVDAIEDHGLGTVQFNNGPSAGAPTPAPAPAPPPPAPAPPAPPAPVTGPVSAPTGLVAFCSNGGHTVTLQWNGVQSATGYYVRLDYEPNNSAGAWYVSADLDYYVDDYPYTQFTASILPDQQYDWWVHGANSSSGIGRAAGSSITCASQ